MGDGRVIRSSEPSERSLGRGHRALIPVVMLLLAMAVLPEPGGASSIEALARVNDDVIGAEDVERALGERLRKLEDQIYELKRRQLDALIAERLLAQEAARRGTTVAALLDAEVTAKVSLVTEQEVDAFYQENKARFRGDEADARAQIRAYLQKQKLAAQRVWFVEELRSRARIEDHLQPPPVVRADVSIDGAPVRGEASAPVTLVEFSDFHCPFCRRVQTTLKELLDRYDGKLKLVYRDFPLDSLHPHARRAAEAARCAHDQGKFWAYHDALFANAPRASSEDLRRYAGQVRLDVEKFDACVLSGVHRATVQHDVDEGTRLGVNGTPAFFINGRLITGAQPLEAFVRLVEEELARASVRP